MNREQAVTIIKQIFDQCNRTEGKSIKLMAPRNNNSLSNTFQVHIQTGDDVVLMDCIRAIAHENGLEIKVKDGSVVVYKPYPDLQV